MSNQGPVTIRRAESRDIFALMELINANLDTVLPRDESEMTDLIGSFFVAEVNDTIVGCCCLEIYSQKIAELRSLVVSATHRGLGIGSRLVQAAVDEHKRLGIRQLLAVTSSVDFFKGHDFGACLNEKFALFWMGK